MSVIPLIYRTRKVIESCVTREQIPAARRYAALATKAIIAALETEGEKTIYIDLYLIDVQNDFNAAFRRTIRNMR